jgi:hypothetical protein
MITRLHKQDKKDFRTQKAKDGWENSLEKGGRMVKRSVSKWRERVKRERGTVNEFIHL